ncbi:MAG: HlyD family efflux transporter periplasmic adaptor subunit [Cyanobacteria bacterium J06638_22]
MSDPCVPEDNQLETPMTEETVDASAQLSKLSQLRQVLSQTPHWMIGLGAAGVLLAIGVPMAQTQLSAQESETAEASEATTLAVETLTVEAVSSYEVARSYTGEIAALRSSDLGFNRGGELVQVLVEEGDRVVAGQALAQLDIQNLQFQRRQLEAQVAAAQAQLLELERGARQEDIAAAQAEVRDFESQLQLQEQQRSRREYLYAEGAISREQLDEFAFGAETIDARLDRARSNLNELLNGTRPEQIAAQRAVVQQLQASLGNLDVDLRKSTLNAPFDGIVSARPVDEGVVVASGQSIVRLVENEAPEARIGMPEQAASRLQPGAAVTVNVNTESYNAVVKSVLPEVDPETRTQVVVFQLEQAALAQVNPGQTVRVELTETIPESGIWLPTQALTQDVRGLWSAYVVVPAEVSEDMDAEDVVFDGQAMASEVVSESMTGSEADAYTVQPKAVEILHQESDRVLVRGTLQAGDRIVTAGIHRLVPGQQVRPVQSF